MTQDATKSDQPRARVAWRTQLLIWILAGLVVGAVLQQIAPDRDPGRMDVALATPPVAVSDTEGRFRALVMHYVPDFEDTVGPTYRAFFEAIEPDVEVVVPVADGEDGRAFVDMIERWEIPNPNRFTIVPIGAEITTWSRDRYTLARDDDTSRWTCLVSTKPMNLNPARANDALVPWALGEDFGDIMTRILPLVFDGGDIMITGDNLFVTRYCFMRNRGARCRDGAEFKAMVHDAFGGKHDVVYIDPGDDDLIPHHHIGMILTPIPAPPPRVPDIVRDADGRVRYGDRALDPADVGRGLVAVASADAAVYVAIEAFGLDLDTSRPIDELVPAVEAEFRRRGCHKIDLSAKARAPFEAVARELEGAGFAIARLPLVPLDLFQYITFNNVVTELRRPPPGTQTAPIARVEWDPRGPQAREPHVYLPTFNGPTALGTRLDLAEFDAVGVRAWETLGHVVHPIPVSRVFALGGSVRCLVHVLRWRS